MLGACAAQVLRSVSGARFADRKRGAGAHRGIVRHRRTRFEGEPPDERRAVRQARRPLLESLRQWLEGNAWRSYRGSRIRRRRFAMRSRAGVRCCAMCEDGRIEIDNNAAERALRAVALGRKNYLFAGSDSGGERAAAIYSLIGSAKLNGIDPEAYLRQVLTRIADHPINRIDGAAALEYQLRHAASVHLTLCGHLKNGAHRTLTQLTPCTTPRIQ